MTPLVPSRPRYEIIRDEVIERYVKTAKEPGARLPSDRELAKEFGVSIPTISKSLSALVADGLVERRVGSGTYAKNIPQQRRTVGIYMGVSALSYATPHLQAYAILDERLQSFLGGRPEGYLHYADMRIPVSQGSPMPSLRDDADEGKLSDLIVCRANAADYAWLDRLPTNVIGFGVGFGRGSVEIDTESLSREGVEYLVGTGCRGVALISRAPAVRTTRTSSYHRLHDAFHEAVRAAGLSLPPEWLQVYDVDDTVHYAARHQESEEFGYRSLLRLWSGKQRPDGVVVYQDVVALGVVRAAAELGIDLNRDLRIVCHANQENVWPALEPYPRITYSLVEAARALLGLVGDPRRATHYVRPRLVLP